MARQLVLVINGYPRTGKDTAACMLSARLEAKGWACHEISSVDPVRHALADLGVPVHRKTPAERNLMAEIQSALLRYDWWPIREIVRYVETRMEHAEKSAFLVHMREPAAIRTFRDLLAERGLRLRTILVDRKSAERVATNDADASVETMTYDLTLDNNGTLEDLDRECARLAERLETSR